VKLSLHAKDIKFLSVSPKTLGEYDVIIELFGPITFELSRIISANIGNQIDIYISDTLVESYPIKGKINSEFIHVGRYPTVTDALARIAYILAVLESS
jgi:hypothetical protein